MADLSILVIHGMGSQRRYYSHPMRDEIYRYLGTAESSRIDWGEVYWADVLNPRQSEYFEEAKRGHDLDFVSLRRFMIHSVGDASAYRKTEDANDQVYDEIHCKVDEVMAGLDEQAEPDRPLVVLAHSLGGHIMSNYIWDIQKPGVAPSGASNFRKMETLAGIVTYGCNIPLFTFAYKKSEVRPIRFPGARLSPAVRELAAWRNYYDPDDILGYPLGPINHRYDKLVEDIPINVGGFLSSWNPMSHGKYWTDNDLTKPVARFIGAILQAV